MCIYTCVCTYVFIDRYIHTYIYIIYIHVYTHIHINTCTSIYQSIYLYKHISIYVYRPIHKYIHLYMHIYMYIYIYVCIHIWFGVSSSSLTSLPEELQMSKGAYHASEHYSMWYTAQVYWLVLCTAKQNQKTHMISSACPLTCAFYEHTRGLLDDCIHASNKHFPPQPQADSAAHWTDRFHSILLLPRHHLAQTILFHF